MKRFLSSVPVFLALALATAVPLSAQEDAPFTVVTTYDVAPPDAPTFEQAVTTFKHAAEQANLAPEHWWNVFQIDSRYIIVGSRASMGSFDDPNYVLSEIRGTPGAAALDEAFAVYRTIDVPTRSEVHLQVPEWSYMPEGFYGSTEIAGVMVFEDWVPFAKQEAFDQNTRELLAALGEMDFPYPIFGSRTLLGENDKMTFVVVHDGLPAFYGENNIEGLIERAGMGERWGVLIEGRMGMMRKTASYPATYRPDLSYDPGM